MRHVGPDVPDDLGISAWTCPDIDVKPIDHTRLIDLVTA